MPARKKVLPLQQLCLTFVSSNLDIWCDENNHRSTENITFNINPIACLPFTLMDDILENAKPLDQRHLDILTHKYTSRLNFDGQPLNLVQRGIELICNVCTNLTELSLSNSTVSLQSLEKMARSIPSIICLGLGYTAAKDSVMSMLGEHCPNLRELDVTCCIITDDGIRSLCERGQCRFIHKLYVNGSSITDVGASIAFRNLPHLSWFNYNNLLKVLENMYKESNNVLQFKLSWIYQENCETLSFSNFTVDAAVAMCQNVTTVDLEDLRNTDDWVLKLAGFPRLEDLSLSGGIEDCITFNNTGIVVRLLKIIGSNLKSLDLEDVRGVNLWYIGIFCTLLEKLRITVVNNCSPIKPRDVYIPKRLFTNLRKLNIFCCPGKRIPDDQLESLLCNCTLVECMLFSQCRSITDGLLSRIFQQNKLSNLRSFEVYNCNNVRKSTLLYLIKNCTLLTHLGYEECANIRVVDHKELQDVVASENFDLVLPGEHDITK